MTVQCSLFQGNIRCPPGENDSEHMFVPAGSMVKGGANLSVVGHVYTDLKASWEVVSKEEDK